MQYTPCQPQAALLVLFGIPVTVHRCPKDPSHCTLTLPPAFLVKDTDSGDTRRSLRARLGTPFLLEYAGRECEVRVERRFIVRDAL